MRRRAKTQKKRKIKVNKFSGLRETRRERDLRRNQGKFTKLERK